MKIWLCLILFFFFVFLAKENKLKLKGTFQCLENKIDLSTSQAETTLQLWEEQLQRLREESSVRAIASAITVTQNNPAVRLLVRRNGEGCDNRGVVVIGNMLSQVSIHVVKDYCMSPYMKWIFTVYEDLRIL